MASQRIRLAVAGAAGRMGQEVLALAVMDGRFEIVSALVAPKSTELGASFSFGKRLVRLTDHFEAPCDVLIDFTVPASTMHWLEICRAKKLPMVTGVTGHDQQQLAAIRSAASEIPIVKAANFSLGMQAVVEAVGILSALLGAEYDVEIVETHHRRKIDAPSGTAKTLVESVVAGSAGLRDGPIVHGREGQVGTRKPGEIGVHAVRMGELIGQHEIHFSGPGETITLRHASQSRATYAAGALHAATWIHGRRPGLYSLKDVTSTRE